MRHLIVCATLLCVMLMSAFPYTAAENGAFMEKFGQYTPDNWYISNGWANGDYQSCEWRANAVTFEDGNLRMTLSDNGGEKRPIGCAEMHTVRRFGFGLYEARMRVAKGSGLNTAFFTYIGPPSGVSEWDEIDFEFLGKDTHTVQLNYYTNGKTQGGTIIQLGFDASEAFHDYAFDWQPTKIRWYIDGKLVDETPDGAALPHNSGFLFLSLWSGAKQEDNWLGHFAYKNPVTAETAWAAFTPAGAGCAFPESMKCK